MMQDIIETGPELVQHSVGLAHGPLSVYFERFSPTKKSGLPTVLMLHGGSHTGACYLLTPDGRPGWAYMFVRAGYPVVVPDWPAMGRSGTPPELDITSEDVCISLCKVVDAIDGPIVLLTHSMGGAMGWRITELRSDKVGAIVAIAPGPPGNIQPVPKTTILADGSVEVETPFRVLSVDRKSRVGKNADFMEHKLVGKSSHFPREMMALYSACLQETPTSLLKNRLNVDGGQVKVHEPSCFLKKPVLVLTGDKDLEHPRDEDQLIVDWLRVNGALVDFWWLPDVGIAGNGHMMMVEANNAVISDMIMVWISRQCLLQ